MYRRNFLVKSVSGLAGLGIASTALASHKKTELSNCFFPAPGTEDGVVEEAKNKIRQVRMKDVMLRITKSDGSPLSNTPVQVALQNHHFLFGENNVGLDVLFHKNLQNSPQADNWKFFYKEVFNAINCTCYWTEKRSNNMVKTEESQGVQKLESFDYTVNWALANNLTVKGHPMFWGVDKGIPDWLKRYPQSTQQKFVEVRIRNLAARFKGRVKLWDAINEMLWEPAPKNLSKRHWPHIESVADMVEYIKPILEWAREEDPDAAYILNDYGTDQSETNKFNIGPDGKMVTAAMQRKRMIELALALKDAGQVPSGLGLQSHSGGWMKPSDQIAFYNEMQTAGLPLHITEFWAHTQHLEVIPYPFPENGDFKTVKSNPDKVLPPEEVEQKQAAYVSNYLTCAFAHPAIESFFFWGFMRMAGNWSQDGNVTYRAPFHAVKKLIKEDWNTNETLISNSEGEVKLKAFHGNYMLRYPLIKDAKPGASVPFTIEKAGENRISLVAKLV